MPLSFYVEQALNSVSWAALLFVLASGLTLIFGVMQIANITHGALYVLAGFAGLTVVLATGSYALGVALAIVTAGVCGILIERVALKPVRGQPLPEMLLTSGLAFIMGDAVLWGWGGDPKIISPPRFLNGSVDLFGLPYPRVRIAIFLVGAAVAIGLWYFLARTRLGTIVRAGVDDREMVASLGIDVRAVFTAVFCLGAMLAGLAGVMGSTMLSVYPGFEWTVLLLAFVVVIIGGMGSLPGAVLGSLVVGLLDTFGKALFPELAYFTIFGSMAVVLALRPRGLLGR